MIRILITEAAFNAIGGGDLEAQRLCGAERYGVPSEGMVPVFLPIPVIEALEQMRQPGEGWSGTIIRYAEAHR